MHWEVTVQIRPLHLDVYWHIGSLFLFAKEGRVGRTAKLQATLLLLLRFFELISLK